ncbi:hypothetical protein GCM10009601_60050 [Streptomyces thermospinosisporus]|uniref:Transketolase C-terminal domain-containing protein n=1 Tax=Streptomyces thermospinosisporus TaxID=161482 RepID=A0ABN1Z756_9ACTN
MRALVIHEAVGFGGYSAELAARLTETCFYHIEASIRRVTGLDVPHPAPRLGSTTCPTPTASSMRSAR